MLRLLLNYLLLFLIGCIDYATGKEIHIGGLYLLAVAVAGWNLRPTALVFHAAAAALMWSTAEWFSGVRYSGIWPVYWNTCNHFVAVGITASTVFKAKSTLVRQQQLIRDLGQTLLKINQFKELAPVCRICHELHLDAEYKEKLDEILRDDAHLGSIGGICPACVQARAERIARIAVDSYF